MARMLPLKEGYTPTIPPGMGAENPPLIFPEVQSSGTDSTEVVRCASAEGFAIC